MTEVVTINELRKLGIKIRSEPIDEYFEDMDISEGQKEERKKLAKELEEIFLFYLILMQSYGEYGLDDLFSVETMLTIAIQEAITPYLSEIDINGEAGRGFVENYARQTAENYIDTYRAHSEDLYMNSEDRALFNAENESNTVLNRKDYMGAIEAGYTQKMWLTMEDKRVRPSHEDIDRLIIPIAEFFQVGNAQMMYPKDVVNAFDHPEEIVNCRCSLRYIKS